MIKEAIVKIVSKQDLTYDEAYAVMNEIMSGETTPTQNAAFLAALSTKSAKAETNRRDRRLRRCHAGPRHQGGCRHGAFRDRRHRRRQRSQL